MLRRGHFAEKADYGMFAIFANDFSSDVPIIFRVVAGDSVPVGRDEPFKRVANENEFGEVAQSVFERVIQMASVQHCHGISVVNDRPRNGRQVIRLNNRLRKDQHEPLQVGAGHLINGIIIIQTHINGSRNKRLWGNYLSTNINYC